MHTIVFIPTYNEAENIADLIHAILALPVEDLGILVVDDRSPDGTGRIVAELAAEDPRIELIERDGPRGRGLAGRVGLAEALARGADRVIEMDGDGSHRPEDIPALLEGASRGDLVIGSRRVRGGEDPERGVGRRIVTTLAGTYLRGLLGIHTLDVTSGFRCYTRRGLERIHPGTLRAEDPFIVTESLFRAYRAGCTVVEIPIRFEERKGGISKLGPGILARYLFKALALRLSGDHETPGRAKG